MPEPTGENQVRDKNGRYVKGVSGNPAGRPKGSRNRLSEDFFDVLHRTFLKHGEKAMVSAATEDPSRFIGMIATLQPKQVDADVDFQGDISHEITVRVIE